MIDVEAFHCFCCIYCFLFYKVVIVVNDVVLVV